MKADPRRYFRRPWAIVPYALPLDLGWIQFPGGERLDQGPPWRYWTRSQAQHHCRSLNSIVAATGMIEYRVERTFDEVAKD